MIGESSVFVGIGQCGGNIGSSIEQKNGLVYYINTASEDLDCIETDELNKFHIPGARGTAKNEEIAKDILFKDGVLDSLCNNIHSRYANSKIVTFGFSASGGTGGTMGCYVAENMKDLYPEKTINIALVLPDKNEDIVMQLNALRCLEHLNEIYKAGFINNIQLLDNNKGDYKKINEDFSMTYTRFLEFESYDANGNFDEEERFDVIMAYGSMAMYEFSSETPFLDGLIDAIDNSVYFKTPKLPEVLGIIASDRVDMDEAVESSRQAVGFAKVTHKSKWEEDSNIVISAGVKFEQQFNLAKNHLEKQAKYIEDERRKSEQEALEEIKSLQNESNIELDINAGRRSSRPRPITQTQSSTNNNPRNRRRRSSSTNLREKYRNL